MTRRFTMVMSMKFGLIAVMLMLKGTAASANTYDCFYFDESCPYHETCYADHVVPTDLCKADCYLPGEGFPSWHLNCTRFIPN